MFVRFKLWSVTPTMARFTGVKKVWAWSSKSRRAAANGGECPFDDAAFWEDDKSMSFHVLDELEVHPIVYGRAKVHSPGAQLVGDTLPTSSELRQNRVATGR
jgi:hypothetical protein